MSNAIGYDSPIEVILGDIKTVVDDLKEQQENAIMTAVQNVGINVDKDELVRALNFDRDQYEKGKIDGVKEVIKRLEKKILEKPFEEFQTCYITWSDIEEVVEEMGVEKEVQND